MNLAQKVVPVSRYSFLRKAIKDLIPVARREKYERLRLAKQYLDLLESCLTGSIYEDPPLKVLNSSTEFDLQTREYGWDWPSKAHTMIGRKRLNNFRQLTETVLMNGTAGDIVEIIVQPGTFQG